MLAVLQEEDDDHDDRDHDTDQSDAWSATAGAGGLTGALVRVADVLDAHGWHSLIGDCVTHMRRQSCIARTRLARQSQEPLADDVALHLARSARDSSPRRGEESCGFS